MTPVNPATVSDDKTAVKCTFAQKWGDDPFTALGHTQVPNALLAYGARLGLAPDECWLITCILSYKFTSADPFPSQDALAAKYGRSVDTVQRVTNSMSAKELLAATRGRNELGHFSHITYDFSALRAALNECYYQDHPQTRPKYSAPVPIPQPCGTSDGKARNKSHTARLRRGSFTVRPCRKKAAVHTAKQAPAMPQGCGTNESPEKEFEEKQTKQEQSTQAGADSHDYVSAVDSLNSLNNEDQDEAAVMEALKLEAEIMVSEDVPKPVPAPIQEPTQNPAPAPPQALALPALAVDSDRAAAELSGASGLGLEILDGYVSEWRACGLGDQDIAQILAETSAALAKKSPPPGNPQGWARITLERKIEARRAQAIAHPEVSLEAKIDDKLATLPPVHAADLDAIRGRFQALAVEAKKEVSRKASLLLRDAAGSEAAYRAIPDTLYHTLMARIKPAMFLALEHALAADKTVYTKRSEIAAFRETKEREVQAETEKTPILPAKPVASGVGSMTKTSLLLPVLPAVKRLLSAIRKQP